MEKKIKYFEDVLIPTLGLVLFSFLLGTLYFVGPIILGYVYFFEIYDKKSSGISRLWALISLIAGQVVLGVITSMFKSVDELIIILIIQSAVFMVFLF
jgi:hypothetical protein